MIEPLENKYPFIFGELDKEQKKLPKPLLLIENATDIVNIIKNRHGFFEDVFERIISDTGSDYAFLGSYTIEYTMKSQYLNYKKFPNIFIVNMYSKEPEDKKSRKYDVTVRKMKNAKKGLKGNMVLHVGARLEGGGHYGIVIKKGREVIIFDSMQANIKGTYTSGTSAFFLQVAKEVFGGTYRYRVFNRKKDVNTDISSVQITGGFVWDPRDKIKIQNMDSQNHFCYMWAIWFFHIFILTGEKGVREAMDLMMTDGEDPHPLIFIKKYIWAMIKLIYIKLEDVIKEAVVDLLEDEIVKRKPFLLLKGNHKLTRKDFLFLRKFYEYHFRYVWESRFKSVLMIIPDNAEINDALDFSLNI
jgi:hypothetical protein